MSLEICGWCDEPVEARHQHPAFDQPLHFACGFRMVAGSVAHIEGRCSCFIVGSEESDPPGMTKREAALAAVRAALRIIKRRPDARRLNRKGCRA